MVEKTDYLARFGVRLAEAGYDVVPIKRGQKIPALKSWQSVEATPALVRKWISNGHAHDGVGIRTARTPGVDIDVTDPAIADAMDAWCQAHLGFAPVRTGNAPKRLLLYRTDTPFRKIKSEWLDKSGRMQKVEILGDGQQFVALAVHPDTKKPYAWSADNILKTAPGDLDAITAADGQAACAEFDRLAAAAGWTRPPKGALAPLTGQPAAASDNMWATVQPDVEISDDELRRYLMAIAPSDYDGWLYIGMALHTHYRGSGDGLALWHEWSSQTAFYNAEGLEYKWTTFATSDGRPTKTARYIIKAGREALAAQGKDGLQDVKTAFAHATTLDDIRKAASAAAGLRLDGLERESLAGLLRVAWKRVEGTALPVATARGYVRPPSPHGDGAPRPGWLKGWAYLTTGDAFYNRDTGLTVSRAGFDAKYNRFMLSGSDVEAGKGKPELSAADAALNVWKIKTVANRLYMPAEGPDFTLNGLSFVNSYRTNLVPDAVMPADWTDADRHNVRLVEAHFEYLYPDNRLRGLILSWFAYLAQTNRRPNWALLLQGTEGDGKTFILHLMGAILGGNNVKTINASSLESVHNSWAVGSQLAIIEEVKLQGHNRHDILNRIKPLITNAVIEVHEKFLGQYQAPNNQAYCGLTNYVDALPLTDNDSRYCVANSSFQSQAALRAFTDAHPDYYKHLFRAPDESPGALRGWLLSMELHPEFDPLGRAPWTQGRDYMARMVASIEQEAATTTLALTTHPHVQSDLLDQDVFEAEVEEIAGYVMKAFEPKRLLSGLGWRSLGLFVIDGRRRRLWSQTPAVWEIRPGVYDKERLAARLKG